MSQLELFDLLKQLLDQLSSSENHVRNAAEDQLNKHWLVQQPQILMQGLAHIISTGKSPHVLLSNID
jgi:hypothetical protein